MRQSDDKNTERESFNDGPAKVFFIVIATLAIVFAWLYLAYSNSPSAHVTNVRVRNDAGTTLHRVKVNGIDYGDIPVGEVTKYQVMVNAYRYADLQVVMAGKQIHLSPEDYVGEQRLGPGRFTYRITSGGALASLNIQAVEDINQDDPL